MSCEGIVTSTPLAACITPPGTFSSPRRGASGWEMSPEGAIMLPEGVYNYFLPRNPPFYFLLFTFYVIGTPWRIFFLFAIKKFLLLDTFVPHTKFKRISMYFHQLFNVVRVSYYRVVFLLVSLLSSKLNNEWPFKMFWFQNKMEN